MNSFDMQVHPEEKMSFNQFTPEERAEFESIHDEIERLEEVVARRPQPEECKTIQVEVDSVKDRLSNLGGLFFHRTKFWPAH